MERRCNSKGIACGKVLRGAEVMTDPQVVHNQIIQEMQTAKYGALKLPKPAPKFGKTKTSLRSVAPTLGEHNSSFGL